MVPPNPALSDAPQEHKERYVWLRAEYTFHTYSYRDPRSAYASAHGLPVVSPTTVLLGIVSTLFGIGLADQAHTFIEHIHRCRVLVEAPSAIIFFRSFHQSRRYVASKAKEKGKGVSPRVGFTQISQATREFGLVDGTMNLYVATPEILADSAQIALRNLRHLGTHDSLCSLIDDVRSVGEPSEVIFLPPESWHTEIPSCRFPTIVTLSRFKCKNPAPTGGNHWWMVGSEWTELAPYLIQGCFIGTTRGKIYLKDPGIL